MSRKIVAGALLVTAALVGCSSSDDPVPTSITITKTVTAEPSVEPSAKKEPRDLSYKCPHALTLMREGVTSWSLHKLSNARNIAERADCWEGAEKALVQFEMEPEYNGSECAQTLRLMVRGVHKWDLHTLSIARARSEAGTCRAYF